MSNDLFKQSLDLYQAGDKKQAREILKILVRQEPRFASAWYGVKASISQP